MMEEVEEENRTGTDISLVFLFVVSTILVTVDLMEINSILYSWKYGLLIVHVVFDSCLKWELITKTVFGIFSFGAAISAFILSLGLLINADKFVNKFLEAFLYFNWLFFGPYMLGFAILAICYWNNVVYVCDKNNIDNKVITPATVFSIFSCLIISSIIVISKSAYEIILFIHDSITRKPDGNAMVRKVFWYYAFRNRNEQINTNSV
jgi:hypothetical protein